ncbi:hypothetical protein QQX09_03095 [Demequina sp. SYSU T00192]|uniref:ATP synthase protein I n=1 Tax=Demequina litoralis TaxID=3051660 RepID=A0ABT8G6R6_9MICO|nr:hypothetical protein [Demequina sp. SYSU T00192]MDN4474839.1 hypothetical protein [Demequina sp. SYSU T00192]
MTAEEQLYRRAIRLTSIVLAAIAVVGGAVAWALAGPAGAVGALVGALVAALGAVPTQVAMLVGHRRPPQVMAGIVAFSWLGKMLVIVVALLVLQGVESFHREAFAATAVTGIVASLVVDVATLRKARIPYADPGT